MVVEANNVKYFLTHPKPVITWQDAMPCNSVWVAAVASGEYMLDVYSHPQGYFVMRSR